MVAESDWTPANFWATYRANSERRRSRGAQHAYRCAPAAQMWEATTGVIECRSDAEIRTADQSQVGVWGDGHPCREVMTP